MTKKYYLLTTTEGCATNLSENEQYRGYYNHLGYEAAASLDAADLILINTCAYTKAMEDKSVSTVAALKAKYPDKEILVAGCMPKILRSKTELFAANVKEAPALSLAAHSENIQFDPSQFHGLSKAHQLFFLIRRAQAGIESLLGKKFQPLSNLLETGIVNESYSLMTVSTGCMGKCSYCAIKQAKGSLRSKPLNVILAELDAELLSGKRKFWFLADDLGCWGQDLGLALPDLLEHTLARKENFSLVLNYIDPRYLHLYAETLIPLMSDPRVKCVNIPIQSGSPTILAKMNREYDSLEIVRIISKIKKNNPSLVVKTNLMVGFPGEAMLDFLRTIPFAFKFDMIWVNVFSPRPNTPAAKMDGQIPSLLKSARSLVLQLAAFLRHAALFFKSFLNPV
jgi:threonylcarbamoyladenosine tRNA methylthiotransferase CDKAL1